MNLDKHINVVFCKRFLFLLVFIIVIYFKSYGQNKLKDTFYKDDITLVKHDTAYVFKTCNKKLKHIVRKKTYYYANHRELGMIQGGYLGKLVDGEYLIYIDQTQLIEKGQFHKGLKDGKWITWYDNGVIHYITKWHKGRLRRKRIEYSEIGEKYKVQVWKHHSWTDKKYFWFRFFGFIRREKGTHKKINKDDHVERDKKHFRFKCFSFLGSDNKKVKDKVKDKNELIENKKENRFKFFHFLKRDKNKSKSSENKHRSNKKVKLEAKNKNDGKKN